LGIHKLGGGEGWNYLSLDNDSRRLFVTRSTHVMVVDADTGKQVGDIPNTPGVYDIALAPDLMRGFTSNGNDNTVTIFDLKTLEPVGKVEVGEQPGAILYEPATKRLFTFSRKSQDATVIDAAKGTVTATLRLPGKPGYAVSNGRGKVFVNLQDTGELLVLDAEELKTGSRWALAPCQTPAGLSIDVANQRLFVGCGNKLMAIVDAGSGKLITTIPVGQGADATVYDPKTRTVFAACADGTMTVVRANSPTQYSILQVVATMQGARTLALDPKTHRLFLPRGQLGAPPGPDTGARMAPVVVPDSFGLLVIGRSF
jgi:DNA-binding beta-propeller fold protein YncE